MAWAWNDENVIREVVNYVSISIKDSDFLLKHYDRAHGLGSVKNGSNFGKQAAVSADNSFQYDIYYMRFFSSFCSWAYKALHCVLKRAFVVLGSVAL